MLDSTEVNEADVHGQLRFIFHHPHIKNGQETQLLLNAFQRDFDVNGPSVLRLARTRLAGWKRYKNSTDSRVRARYRRESRSLGTTYGGALWAAKKWFANNPVLQTKIDAVLRELHREFGLTSRLLTPIVGRYIYSCVRSEDRRLRAGLTYEPPTFYESNHHNGHLIPMGVIARH